MGWSCDYQGFSLFKVDSVEIEAWIFNKQQIVRRLRFEAHWLGQQPLSHGVIDLVVQYYSVGAPTWNYNLRTLVIRLTLSIHLA